MQLSAGEGEQHVRGRLSYKEGEMLEGALSSQAWEPWGSDSVEPQPVFIGEHQALISHLEGHGAQRGRCTGRTERKKLVS